MKTNIDTYTTQQPDNTPPVLDLEEDIVDIEPTPNPPPPQVNQQPSRLWPDLVTAADLCASPPPTPAELINGMFYRGGTMMLSGASKAHKTFTMLAAGVAIATGREWLGFQTNPVPVIYLNLELQGFSATKRLTSICAAMGVNPPANLHLLNLRGHIATVDAFEKNIPALIERTGAGLVVVDPHYKLSSVSGIEENSNDGQANLLTRIEAATHPQGAAVMIAHHFAKGDASAKNSIDRAAGGGSLARFPDVVMTLTEHEEPDCSTMEFHLRDFAPVGSFVARWQHPVWARDDALNPANLKRAAGRKETYPADKLLEVLTDGMTNSEWHKASGWAYNTFNEKRKKLDADGKIENRAGLYYRKAD